MLLCATAILIRRVICNLVWFLLDEEKAALPLLSESLVLDNLWETLSACLLELEYTPDHHAVLVLQVKKEAYRLFPLSLIAFLATVVRERLVLPCVHIYVHIYTRTCI